MPFVPTAVPAGVMNWTDVQTNLDDARSWLNNIPSGDVVDASIRREHLVRPLINGWPTNGAEGEFNQAYRETMGLNQPSTYERSEWGAMPDRLIIVPKWASSVLQEWRTPVSKPFYFARNVGYVTATLSMDVAVRASNDAASAPNVALYPDGAGGANMHQGGYFSLHLWDWSAGTDADIPSSRAYVYPTDYAFGVTLDSYGDHVLSLAHRELSAPGYYEVQLVYHINFGEVTFIDQVDCTNIQLSVEVN